MDKRIFHGMTDVAGQGSYDVLGLKENKYNAEMVVWRKNFFGYNDNKSLNIQLKPSTLFLDIVKIMFFAIKAAFNYDVFHFHASRSLIPFGLDLPLLKVLNRQIFMEYHGSEVRGAFNEEVPNYWPSSKKPKFSKRYLVSLKFVAKIVDGYILHDSELEKYLPSDRPPVLYVPLKIDVDRFKPYYPINVNKKVRIIHAPSENVIKGSKYVFEAIDELSKKYDIEYVLVQNTPREEALKIFETADIIVDQLFIGSYGVFAIEAMSMGKPVISYISEEMLQQFPVELPIVSADIYSIKEKLESLILDSALRNELGVRGRKYVEDYHDYKFVTKELAEIYEGKYLPISQKMGFQRVKELKEGLQ